MKLPQANLEPVYRDGRWDPHRTGMSPGVEPMFLGDVWNKVKKWAKPVACAACNAIPHPAAKIACMAACSL